MADIAQKECLDWYGCSEIDLKFSRTHCRGVAAVSMSDSVDAIGVDVEYEDSRRDWKGILGFYCPSLRESEMTFEAYAKGWTFLEAHYKAEGSFADASLLKYVVENDFPYGKIIHLNDAFLYFLRPRELMTLCVYWTANSETKIMVLDKEIHCSVS